MLNRVSLMGRLVADPELKKTPSGVSVVAFTVASSRDYVKQGEERQADFVNVIAWRNNADFLCRYFKKGQLVVLTGGIQTRMYTDKNGDNRKSVEVVADQIYFAGERVRSEGDQDARISDPQCVESDDYEVISDDEDLPF